MANYSENKKTLDYLIKTGMDEAVASEINEYTKQKEKRKKRLEKKFEKEDNPKWK